jgi:hypothetical protein
MGFEDPRPRIGLDPPHLRQNVGHVLPRMRGWTGRVQMQQATSALLVTQFLEFSAQQYVKSRG